ncbi:MAG TPA: DNA mismatch repair endonuclease MutL [Kofleriaceae bacterium]|nr:DNA mismatch repair endonuclease MutL [Kofleriaceae bacterium]
MIAVLAPHVIDQIAAGEVIERPASVVKELVDNAIDAGAATITVEVAAGGRALVRVSDDGCGMSAEAAVLAFERHATSKLREVDDLWGIASMGFRGEALPSIASVSRVTLTTRRAGDDAATRITFEAGRRLSVSEAGAPVGTTVEVTDLLYNQPARLKFLKGEATEASHVTELVAKVAMAYPRLHLRLKHNGRTALDTPPDRDGLARAQALLGPRIAGRLIPALGEESGVRVTAYLGAPELAQATARGVQLFVGRRPVRDRGLLHALAMGYGELIPRGRYPIAVVLLDVPAGAVDVNVHPQKLEVRFADLAAVTAAVRHVVQSGVAAARWRDEAGGAGPVQVLASVAPPALPFDGQATQLSERHVAQMKSRQVSLGFAAGAEAAIPWPLAGPTGAQRSLDLPDPAKPPAAARSAAPSTAGAAASGASVAGRSPRDWARHLRDQTREAREVRGDGEAEPGSAGGAGRADSAGGEASAAQGPDPASAGGAGRADSAGGEASAAQGPDPGSAGGAGRADSAGGEASAAQGSGRPGGFRYAVPPGSDQPDRYAHLRWASDSAPVGGAGAGGGAGRPGASPDEPDERDAPGDSPGGPALGLASGPAPGSAPGSAIDPVIASPFVRSASGRESAGAPAAAPGYFSQLRYLGQVDLTYLACEGDGELVLIDQHAAHERVELGRLRARHAGGSEPRVAVQNMLFPVTLDATPAQLALVARVGGLLAQVGFEVEPFGPATLAVKAVPAVLRHGHGGHSGPGGHGDPAQLLRKLLAVWAADGAPSDAAQADAARIDALLGEIACHSVVRAGDRLTPSEAEALLRSLDGVDLTLPAPHGRAVLLRLPLTEIGRRFGR